MIFGFGIFGILTAGFTGLSGGLAVKLDLAALARSCNIAASRPFVLMTTRIRARNGRSGVLGKMQPRKLTGSSRFWSRMVQGAFGRHTGICEDFAMVAVYSAKPARIEFARFREKTQT